MAAQFGKFGFLATMCLSMGAWLSWLERAVHIREVIGSSPIAPIVLFPQEGHESPLGFFLVHVLLGHTHR